jgi:hypothetical protein
MIQAAKDHGHIRLSTVQRFNPHNRGMIKVTEWTSCTDFGDWVMETLERDRNRVIEGWTELPTEQLRIEALDRLSAVPSIQEIISDKLGAC